MTSPPEPTWPVATGRDAHTVWQVKASTLCNLRCAYCYEWDRLGDRRRFSLDDWRRIFDAMRGYQRLRAARHGVESRIVVVWHGGEPLLLPRDYVRDVLRLEREILGDPADPPGYVNGIQTKLSIENDTLALMCSAGFMFGVSLDGAPGARLDQAGRPTESRVLANLERLLSQSVTCGVALVLGRHNVDRLPAVYDRLERMGVSWLRIIPLFRPPASAPGAGLELEHEEVVSSLSRLFDHWMRRGRRLHVQPLARLLGASLRRHERRSATVSDRRRFGETRLVVHPDGTLSAQAGTAAPPSVLGNVFTDAIDSIATSAAHEASLQLDDALRRRHCAGCPHGGVCDTRAIFDYPHAFAPGPCPIESRLLTIVEERLRHLGCDRLHVS
jgi:uncharacterized protein